jgi:hypothetical protein
MWRHISTAPEGKSLLVKLSNCNWCFAHRYGSRWFRADSREVQPQEWFDLDVVATFTGK